MGERNGGLDRGNGGWRLRRVGAWFGVIAGILMIPLVAMQVSDEVKWDPFDFVFMGGLLAGVATAYELAASRGALLYRAGAGVALAAALLLVWINGAVGMIGNEDNPANLMFAGVLAVALVGSMVARFRAAGMAGAMMVAALAQLLAGVIALVAGWGASGEAWPRDAIVLTGFFTAMWGLSAWLFRKAAR